MIANALDDRKKTGMATGRKTFRKAAYSFEGQKARGESPEESSQAFSGTGLPRLRGQRGTPEKRRGIAAYYKSSIMRAPCNRQRARPLCVRSRAENFLTGSAPGFMLDSRRERFLYAGRNTAAGRTPLFPCPADCGIGPFRAGRGFRSGVFFLCARPSERDTPRRLGRDSGRQGVSHGKRGAGQSAPCHGPFLRAVFRHLRNCRKPAMPAEKQRLKKRLRNSPEPFRYAFMIEIRTFSASCGSARPRVAFMTAPTSAFMAFSLPPR